MIYEGQPTACDGKIAIVVAKFNKTITQRLLDGALYKFKSVGMKDEQLDVFWTPGSFELPSIVESVAETGLYRAVVALGAVIKGETTHDQYINQSISRAFVSQACDFGIPILFGVLTCLNVEQANARSTAIELLTASGEEPAVRGGQIGVESDHSDDTAIKADAEGQFRDKTVAPHLGNKGLDCAEAALEMINLLDQIERL